LAVEAVFDGAADLSGLAAASGSPLHVGACVHKTLLNIDEEGTEAAAATAIAIETTSARLVSRNL
jgi:serpin B